jgi:hypothetical protein
MTKAFLYKNWPLALVLLLLWSGLAFFLAICLGSSGGHLVYPLDDPYIHMAMAKNFAQHAVWGVTRYEFSFSSSSPLWTALLSAAFFVFGTSVWIPLLINAILASLLCVLLYVLLRRAGAGPWLLAAGLPLVVFLTPMIVLATSGLEHLLHTCLAICFVYSVASRLSEKNAGLRSWLTPSAIGALLVLTRYEGLFLLFVAVGLVTMRKKWAPASTLAVAGLLPISIIGLLAVSRGWGFFPNSILLKGNLPVFSSLTGFLHFCLAWARQLIQNPHLLALLALLVLIGFARIRRGLFFEDRLTLMIMLTVGTLLLHLQFARTGWLFRYEAYLVALGLFITVYALADSGTISLSGKNYKRLMVALTAAFAAFGSIRGISAHRLLPVSVKNIYEQQIQTAIFLGRYYRGQSIALNDIGAPNFMTDIHCLDLWGLASREVGELKMKGIYNTRAIADLSRKKSVVIAIVYEKWFATSSIGGLPPEWILAGRLRIPANEVCGDDTLSFFAVDPAAAAKLSANLREFAPRLPDDVEVFLGDTHVAQERSQSCGTQTLFESQANAGGHPLDGQLVSSNTFL